MLLYAAFTVSLYSQTGLLKGRILEQSTKEPLPAAGVQLVGTQMGASADENGEFVISNIPVGTYQVRASLVGFEPLIQSDVIVAAARPVELSSFRRASRCWRCFAP